MNVITQDKKYETSYNALNGRIDITDGKENYFINLKEIITLKTEPLIYECIEPKYNNGTRIHAFVKRKATLTVKYDTSAKKVMAIFNFVDVEGRSGNDKEIIIGIDPEVFARDILLDFLSEKRSCIINGKIECISNAAKEAVEQLPNTNVVMISTYADHEPCIFELRDNTDQLVALAQIHPSSKGDTFRLKTYSNIQLSKIKEMCCITPFLKFGVQITDTEYIDKSFSIITFSVIYLSKHIDYTTEFKCMDLTKNIEELKTQYSLRTETFAKKSKLMKIGL